MVELVRQRQPAAVSALEAPFLAADVGGTHARIGLVRRPRHGGRVEVLAYRKYACAEFPDLGAILKDFIGREGQGPLTHCAMACAGYVLDDAVINYNLPWKVSLRRLRQDLGVQQLSVINDFEAVAYAARFVAPADTQLLTGPEQGEGPLIVVGPGTGLGSSVCIPGKSGATVLATEAGQINLAPMTARERDLLARLAAEGEYVSYERLLCGPGLRTLYGLLCDIHDMPSRAPTPEAITAAALAATDAVAVETLEIFCGLLGSFVGNLAMLYGAQGGAYLTGGILPAMRDFLMRSDFVARFLDKGRMRAYLERVPVRLMEHGQLGVIGAAGLYLDNWSE